MKYTLKAFGVTKDILGGKEITFEMEGQKVGDLKRALIARYPDIESLNSLFIAVNNAYATDEATIAESDEIALIPPVSGG